MRVSSLALIALLALPACGGRQQAADTRAATGDTTIAPPSAPPRASRRDPVQRGLTAMERGRFTEAIAWFDDAIAETPNNADAFANRAVAQMAISAPNRALHDASRAVELSDDTAHALNLAHIQVRVGLFDLAIPSLRALRTNADVGHDASALLGIALIETNALVEATEVLRDVVARDPSNPDTLTSLGVIAERNDEPVAAEDFYNRAIGADDEHLPAWRNLAMLYHRQDRVADAERALERYLLLAPADTIDRPMMQGRLDQLRAQ